MTRILIITFSLVLSLSSCLYKMDIEQGNAVDKERMALLETGMNKKQVRFLLGKPAIKDIYHEHKWHYLRTLKSNSGRTFESKTMVLTFDGDTLITINGTL